MKIKTPLFKIEIEWLMIVTIIISIFSTNARKYLSNFIICYIFILFHELSHMFFGTIFGENVDTLKLTISGVSVCFEDNILEFNVNKIEKLIIYFAGPLANFFIAIFFRNINMVFEINIFLGLINLLPIYPLDGYNILYTIVNGRKNILKNVSIIIFFILITLSVIQLMLYKMFSFAIFTIYLVLISKKSQKQAF